LVHRRGIYLTRELLPDFLRFFEFQPTGGWFALTPPNDKEPWYIPQPGDEKWEHQ
jgi:hypothetical protein